ncbi:MAG TPA: aldehyde dehydrogenase (NADP(+)) [Edaphobacter sp.]|jgi:NADP-dependent aldehyde dehydrogenase|nr:aldehyde dehydrogenase (NADP(+)) [Edaphobacter sp.]
MDVAQVLIDGKWRAADAEGTFHAENPAKGEALPLAFPISRWSDCDTALTAATKAAGELRTIDPARIAGFLDAYAANIEASADSIVAAAAEETALPATPRLKDVELPRTTNQLRQAAAAAREESWRRATLDLEKNIRSCFSPIGPVVIFGPNNFPFAFNGVSGGDFAAAIAAGNPVIAKAHPLHPNTTRLLAEQAFKAVQQTGLPPATVQLIYNVSNENGLKLVSDPRVGAVGFTGSRNAGLRLKRAAEDAGKPIYLEMSSINPVIFLPGALAERPEQLATELVDSVLAGSGQFCTSPNLVLPFETPENKPQTESFLNQITKSFNERPAQPLLSAAGRKQLHQGVTALTSAGAKLVTGGDNAPGDGYRYANTLLRATAAQFLAAPRDLQREIFGNATLAVTVNTEQELQSILHLLEGNLTGTIYSAKSGADDETYNAIAPLLRDKVGRLLNDKMPTGVAVSPAMNHGGPYPSTSHPGSTSVGIPTSITRFAKLDCYDAVRPERLPAILKDKIANPNTWRSINGAWVKG